MKALRNLLRLTREIRYSRSSILLIVIFGIISGACNTGLLILINEALNTPGPARSKYVWGFAAFCVIFPLTRFISETLLIALAAKGMNMLRIQLCRRILAAPLPLLEKLGSPKLMAALTDDAPTIANALATVPFLCMNIAMMIGCLAYLGWLSWGLLLGVLGFMVLGIVSYQLPLLRALSYYRRARELGDKLFGAFRALTSGTKELKLHSQRREAFLNDHLEQTSEAMYKQTLRGNIINTAATSWGHILFFIVIGLLLFALPSGQSASAQVLTGYALTLLFMITPLQSILNTMPTLGRANVAMQKVESLGLSLTSRPSDLDQTKALPATTNPAWASLELRGVTHAYHREGEESAFVLGPIDLNFYPGELVFLTGGNGSGKTTLAKILTGLYTPETGDIRFNGQVVTNDNRDAYRQNFAVVFSDFFLFENLLGLDGPELDAKAREYLLRLQLNTKVQVKDGALSTIDLSQGQRKRLALLTAYLEDRPIYLFDEWAADQDPYFKEIFYHQILPELVARGKTVLVISHDNHYYHLANRLIHLDYGQVEYDNHNTAQAALGVAEAVAVPK
ncbi:MAG: putative pyoverdin transport system ATP-binding/permease protein [Blastocatellia bacterium]|jgi:putative ATP-binding cassette transporter|nr:putative pyoverdin transport system ATP-binding/permease protein [Blastocatellia bacterium]